MGKSNKKIPAPTSAAFDRCEDPVVAESVGDFDTSDVESVEAMIPSEPLEPPPFLVITTAKGTKRKRRCDMLFTSEPSIVEVSKLAPGDYERLTNEPELRCEPVDELEAEVLAADLKERGDYGNDVVSWRVACARLRQRCRELGWRAQSRPEPKSPYTYCPTSCGTAVPR